MTELKPCPFCGGEAVLSLGGEHFTIPECANCGAKLPAQYGQDRKTKAIEAWNTRAERCGYWMRHDESDTWECPSCHACFDLDGDTPKDKYLNYCPVCGTKLELPE